MAKEPGKTKKTAKRKPRAKASGTAFERGAKIIAELGWGEDPLPRIGAADRDFWRLSVEHLFGDIWSRPGLSIRDRELVTLATLITTSQQEGMKPHFQSALRLGFTPEQLREVVIQVMHYAGWPAGTHGIVALSEAIKARAEEGVSSASGQNPQKKKRKARPAAK